MTVTVQTNKVTINGNGVARVHSFSPMVIFASDEVVVTKRTSAGVESTISEGATSTTYSVDITNFPATGSISYPATGGTLLASGETLTIKRVMTLEQQTDLNNQGGYFADVQENQFDKLVMIAIQIQEELDRAIKVPVSYTGGASLALPEPEASTFLGWNAAGDALINATAVTSATVSTFMATVLDDLTQAAALTTLGVGTGDSPTFTGIVLSGTIELGHATDTTLARASAGDVNIEGNIVYRAGGTDVPITDGGTGSSSAAAAATALAVLPTAGGTMTGPIVVDTDVGLTASVTQSMVGALALTAEVNIVTTVANTSDSLGLLPAAKGTRQTILNSGANAAAVWPNNGSSDTIDGGSADAVDANLLAAGDSRTYISDGSTNWVTETNTPETGVASVQVFTGNGTWTKPAGVTSVMVWATGGGGGGGGISTDAADRAGGSGGGGGTSIELIDVTGTGSETVTVGAAGAAGASGAGTGGTGGTSSFGSLCTAAGGVGGGGAGSGTVPGGAGGVGAGGDVNLTGSGGGTGGSIGSVVTAGPGGSSYFGGGAGGIVDASAGAAPAATAYGGGGTGAASSSGDATARAGGAGAAGVVIVWEVK